MSARDELLRVIVDLRWRVAVDVLYRSIHDDFLHDNVQYAADDKVADSDDEDDRPGWDGQATFVGFN